MGRSLSFLGAVLAAFMQLGVAHARVHVGEFCSSRSLSFSPNGRYIFASSDAGLSYADIDCLLIGRSDCQVTTVTNPDAFPRGAYFGATDEEIFLVSAGVDGEGRATGSNTLRAFSTQHKTLSGQRPYFQTGQDVLGFIDAERTSGAFAASDEAAADLNSRILSEASRQRSLLSANARNIYGRVADGRSVYLVRSDRDFSVSYRLDGGPERPLWSNGNPFSQRRANLEFKFDGPDAIGLVSGSVVRISPEKPLRDETRSKSRAILLDGDNPAKDYGYWTAERLEAKDVRAELVAALNRSISKRIDSHILGLSVHNGAGAILVSYGPFRSKDGRATTRHDILQGARSVTLECDGDQIARQEVRRFGGQDGIFVQRYIAGERPTVIYVGGGPGQHLSLDDGFGNDIATLLDEGFNVDVVQYGGSDYTFALYDRLQSDGPASLRKDAALIQAYVRKAYGSRGDISLYAFSFGASFYRYFDQKFLAQRRGIVLAAPSGTVETPDFAAVADPVLRAKIVALSSQVNATLWGKGTIQETNRHFANLQACPIVVTTTIVVGEKDRNVSPRRDYASCEASSRVRFLSHPYGHISPLDPYYKGKINASREVIEALRGVMPDRR